MPNIHRSLGLILSTTKLKQQPKGSGMAMLIGSEWQFSLAEFHHLCLYIAISEAILEFEHKPLCSIIVLLQFSEFYIYNVFEFLFLCV